MLWTQLLFFFSALGVFNGLLLVVYQLVIVRPRRVSGMLLGFLGLAFCIRVGVSCIYYFEKVLPWTVVQIGLSAHILIGPLLLAYLVSVWEALAKWRPWAWQILILFTLLLTAFGLIYPFVDHVKIWDYEIRYSLHFLLSIFLLLTTYLLYYSITKRPSRSSLTQEERFSLLVYVIAVLICGGFALSLYVDYVLGPIISSLLFYLALIFFLLQKRTRKPPSYARKISPAEADKLVQQVQEYLQATQSYRNPKLTIGELAKQLKWPKAQLSQLLNDNLGLSFTAYINQFRVQEAKQLLRDQPLLTVEAIGYEVGFGSRSSFFSTFKQHTGLTPRKFQDSLNL